MKRSTNFNGMKRYRGLNLEDFVLTCKHVGMSDDEIIQAVKDMQQDKESSEEQKLPADQQMHRVGMSTLPGPE
jgi:hypothetical protein